MRFVQVVQAVGLNTVPNVPMVSIVSNDSESFINHEKRRVERRRAAVQVSDFRCVRPFGLRGKWPPDHQHVSSSLSKIPYGGFSPVRLQTGIQPRPSSTMPSLSARPASPHPCRIYTRLQSLSPKRANCFRSRTCVQSGLSFSDPDDPVQRSLAPQRVMLSRRIIAYYYPWEMSSITTRVNNQFPRLDFHQLDEQPYRLRTKVTKFNFPFSCLSCFSWFNPKNISQAPAGSVCRQSRGRSRLRARPRRRRRGR
jgi:hypothetical protein